MENKDILESFMKSRNIFYIERDIFGNIICDDKDQLKLYK